jgi:hypothetical protein
MGEIIVKRDVNKLNNVMATIVQELGEVGVFHFNKLAYLFEYFYIKNFGKRYTKEQFCKLPHGPVISGYKKYISDLKKRQLINVDLDNLMKKRTLDDLQLEKIKITKTDKTFEGTIKNPELYKFIKQLANKFGKLTTPEIEEAVYSTPPVAKIKQAIENGLLKETGSYILKGNGIRMKDYRNGRNKSRLAYMKHLEKYPKVNKPLQKELREELAYLTKLRPSYE